MAMFKSQGRTKLITLTRTKTIPFTSEVYEQEYGQLSPELQAYFVSPSELKAQKQARIQQTRSKVIQELSTARAKMQTEEDQYQKERERINRDYLYYLKRYKVRNLKL